MSQDLLREKGLTEDYIETVKNATNKNLTMLQGLKNENKYLNKTIKHAKDLIEQRNPANSRNQELINFENSSIRSGGNTISRTGSIINEVQRGNLGAALTSLSYADKGGLTNVSKIYINLS